jgi:hypothetical protein
MRSVAIDQPNFIYKTARRIVRITNCLFNYHAQCVLDCCTSHTKCTFNRVFYVKDKRAPLNKGKQPSVTSNYLRWHMMWSFIPVCIRIEQFLSACKQCFLLNEGCSVVLSRCTYVPRKICCRIWKALRLQCGVKEQVHCWTKIIHNSLRTANTTNSGVTKRFV